MIWLIIVAALLVYLLLALLLSTGLREITNRKSFRDTVKENPPYYVLAYLSGGIRNAVFSMLYRLNQERILEFNQEFTRISKLHESKLKNLSQFEQAFCSNLGESQQISASLTKENLTRLKPLIDSDPFLLTHPELVFTHEERALRNERSQQSALIGFLILTGIVLGLIFDQSYTILGALAMAIPFAIVMYVIHWICFNFPANTGAGEHLKYHHYTLNPKPMLNLTAIPLAHRISLLAIYGPEVFALLGWNEFKDQYVRKDYSIASSSGSGCGSSCSSSSCGSSCSSSGGGGDGGSSCGGGCGGCGGGD